MNTDKINLQYTTIKEPLPDFIYNGLATYSKNANSYKPQPAELIDKLAKKHNIPSEMIYLTAGIDEAIQMFILAYGQNTYVFTPTYVVYSDVKELGGELNPVASIENNKFLIKTEKISDATLIFLANPNNPSGVTSKEKVIELVVNNSHAKVVIDEAYGDFADLSVIDQVKNYPHMAVFRSFSKGYSMAGNRLGYIVADPEIIKKVKNKSQWANVSYLSVGAGIVALDHEDYFAKIREDIGVRRDEFIKFLKESGYTVLQSKINTVLIRFEDEEKGTKFTKFLIDNNFIISQGNGNSNIGLDNSYVRIAIGTKEQMKILESVILKYRSA